MRWLGIGFSAAAVLLFVVPQPAVRPAIGFGIAGLAVLGLAALMSNRRAGIASDRRTGAPYRDEPVAPMSTFVPRPEAKVEFASSSNAYWTLIAFDALFLIVMPAFFVAGWTGHLRRPPFISREFHAVGFAWGFSLMLAGAMFLWRDVKRRVVGYEDRLEVLGAAGRVVFPLRNVVRVNRVPGLKCGVIRVKFADENGGLQRVWFVCEKDDESRIVEFLRRAPNRT